MKTMYIDCHMGAAGDMLTSALLELIPDKKGMIDQLNAIGIPGVVYSMKSESKCGITGTQVSVHVNGVEEDEHMHDHSHVHEDSHEHIHNHSNENHDHHDHDHHHGAVAGHHHNSLHNIEHVVRDHLTLPKKVADDVMAVYTLIAKAESHAHGVPIEDIHFHEVGTMDAVADITAVCLLMYVIAPERVVVSPIHVGSGQIKCAHGILPVPAPATAFILRNVPTYSGDINGELCTPTGAALLRYFATEFSKQPAMCTESIGYGMGKKEFPVANCVRILLGEDVPGVGGYSEIKNTASDVQTITELNCNVDDMSGEEIGYAIEKLLEGGALEAFSVPIIMKKSRPGIMLTVLVNNKDVERIVEMIFKHTTTIGIRKSLKDRYVLERDIHVVKTPYGDVREKVSKGYGVTRRKYEYDDIAAIASEHNVSMADVIEKIDYSRMED